MKLFLCEKPSRGRDIANELGATQKGSGFLAHPNDSVIVTWGFWHLVEQFSLGQYDPTYKPWLLETLPIILSQWEVALKKRVDKTV